MIIIDYFKEEDFSGLCDLMKHWREENLPSEEMMKISLSHILVNSDHRILIAKYENKITGYAQITKCLHLGFEPFIEVLQLLVAEDRRSSGIGKSLMLRIEDEAVKGYPD